MSKITQQQVESALENEFDGYPLDCIIQELLELREQARWIPVGDNSIPKPNSIVELCWRPSDYKVHPSHRELVVGSFVFRDVTDKPVEIPVRVWVNGRYYDIKTHITHWRYVTLPKETDE